MHKRGISQFSVEKVFSHSAEKLSRETFRCSRNIQVSNKYHTKDAEGCHEVLLVFFCLTVPKTLYGKSSVFQKFSDTKKIVDKKGDGGSIRIFRRNFFCLIVSKTFVGYLFGFSFSPGVEIFFA